MRECGVEDLGSGVVGNAGVPHEGESQALFDMDGSGQGAAYLATNGVGRLLKQLINTCRGLGYTTPTIRGSQ